MINHLEVVRKHYPLSKRLIIIMDNATWHKTKIVKEYCEQNNIEPWYTPPYAPEYNPIERVWNFMKSIVKKEIFVTAEYFKQFITKLFESLQYKYNDELCRLCYSLI